jgi:hypothetical protein
MACPGLVGSHAIPLDAVRRVRVVAFLHAEILVSMAHGHAEMGRLRL